MRTERCVVHVANVADARALETLCRITPVIGAAGLRQIVLLLDEKTPASLTWSTWSAAVEAELRALRCAGLSMVAKTRALQAELAALYRESPLHAVHLHGIGPCLLGSRALRGNPMQARILCSPHAGHLNSLWHAALGHFLEQQLSSLANYAALAVSLAEAQALSRVLHRSAELLPRCVSDVFFAVSRQEAGRPTVLADGTGSEAMDVLTRLCVLLNGREARVRFVWLGPVDRGTRAALQAANVETRAVADDAERANFLSQAWAFLHLSRERDLPVPQAMAAGVVCLVSDTPLHRSLIRHGDNGFICTSERDFVEKLVLVLRDRAERTRVGEAARAEAHLCFTSRHFERSILRAYGLSRMAKPPGQGALGAPAKLENV
jgi:hypothetical protein